MNDDCNCASGTAHNDGAKILEAVRQQQSDDSSSYRWRRKAERLQELLEEAEHEARVFCEDVESLETATACKEDELNALANEKAVTEKQLAEVQAEFAAYKAVLG